MRTNVHLNDDLLARARRFAVERGETLTEVLERALLELLLRNEPRREQRPRVPLPTFRGRGLKPGVQLDDSTALLDLMERRDDHL